MSADEIRLLLVGYLLLLSDSFLTAHAPALVLYGWNSRWRIKSTETAFSLGRRYWLIRPLLPPTTPSFLLTLPRCSFGTKGFTTVSPLRDSLWMEEKVFFIPYDEVRSIRVEGHDFRVNGQTWFRGPPVELEKLRLGVEKILKAVQPGEAVRRMIRSEFKLGLKAGKHLANLEKAVMPLNLLCSLYAVVLLVFLPGLLYFRPARLSFWGIGAVLMGLHLLCGFFFLRIHSGLMPEKYSARWESLFKMSLCPPIMIRACDEINDQVGIPGDSLAMAMSLLDRSRWFPVIQKSWRQLRHQPVYPMDSEIVSAVGEFSSAYLAVFEQSLKGMGLSAADLEVNPAEVPDACSYCPRCGSFYRMGIPTCRDCGELPLVPGRDEPRDVC